MSAYIDKIAWIHIREGKVLCARSIGKDIYYLPGGKREPEESDRETLCREIEEEISVRIRPDSVGYYGTFEAQAHGKADGIPVRMACYTADYSGELQPAAEIEELAWLSYADRERVSAVCWLIFDHLHERKVLF